MFFYERTTASRNKALKLNYPFTKVICSNCLQLTKGFLDIFFGWSQFGSICIAFGVKNLRFYLAAVSYLTL